MSDPNTGEAKGEARNPKDVLAGAAVELDRLARIATDLDDAIGDLVATGHGRQLRRVAQNADYLRQSVECIGRLVRNLSSLDLRAETLPMQVLSEGIHLQAVRDACFGLKPEGDAAARAHDCPELYAEQGCKP